MPKIEAEPGKIVSPVEIDSYLKGVDFPADLDELIEHASQNGAPLDVINMLEQMPDREYGSAADVAKGYGQAYDEEE